VPPTFSELLAEGAGVPVEGWDFSWFEGRATEERPPWGYSRLLAQRMAAASAALDLQTGGGEVLAQIPHPPPVLVATESWPPNLQIARRNLARLGGSVLAVDDDGDLPFPAGTFDLVTSRHPVEIRWDEVARVLMPGGTFLSQQVGAGSVRELTDAMMGPQEVSQYRSPHRAVAEAEAAGLEIVDLRTAALRMEFYDVAAVVVFLRKVIWIVPGFTVDRYRPQLAGLHERIQAGGPFIAQAQRFLIEARRPTASRAEPRPPGRGPGRRALLSGGATTRSGEGMKLISWLAAGGIAGWGAARLAGADRIRSVEAPVAPLLAFTPQVAAAALLSPVLLRRKGAAATAALAGAALAAVVLPRALKCRQPRADGALLRVLTANLLAGRAAEDALVGLVRQKNVDVLFVQELTDTAVNRLKQAGLNDLLPHEIIDVRGPSASGSGIYARLPLTDGLQLAPNAMAQPTARIELGDGQCAELVCVHAQPPNPPVRARVARWRRELAALPVPSDPPRVLAGDFNATVDHAAFRRVLRRGHIDAATEMGRGLIPTWGPLGGPALLTLDHVLIDPRCAVQAASVHRLPGSDHRAVYAEFRLPG
jgi:endonuclease/exonuclease/phosphatase (EEP) superfamily protein YafD/SAM-dependent methyltransferase